LERQPNGSFVATTLDEDTPRAKRASKAQAWISNKFSKKYLNIFEVDKAGFVGSISSWLYGLHSGRLCFKRCLWRSSQSHFRSNW